jgi:hypothetical protein
VNVVVISIAHIILHSSVFISEDSRQQEEDLSPHFPGSLFDMLEDAEVKGFSDVVSWFAEGDGFKIHQQEAFIATIAPKYFKFSQYKSFLRQL